mmetsp:Transcript_34106/g.109438  ORF Transcript_34106/g.109438 Transcript_34106/m.109438 type:complete len:937 (+) Transcript_34106:202-3012(+)|eukprot:CAMPEP_0118892776 /NCGR_PEP_ID=MMETSP1166-20130328/2244_1 /TAXON_ID=1104430 /ORGANISM="Chrysoreinhardia sp, Strain CCMP3193" /LENGTH=936 /DNA_ID=CAMNT_0006831527 /DNA_START=200 /DNA_END=3010 /DNA_ORIENTATION=-
MQDPQLCASKLLNAVSLILEESLGLADRTLTEFVVALVAKYGTKPSFASALAQHGAQVPTTVCNRIFDLLQRPAHDSNHQAVDVARRHLSIVGTGPDAGAGRPTSILHEHSATATSLLAAECEAQQISDDTMVKPDKQTVSLDGASDDLHEDIEIDLNQEVPTFLKNKTHALREMPPIQVVRDPDGSLQRAAVGQQSLARDRFELQIEATTLVESMQEDLHRPWEDPVPNAGERHFAQDLRSMNLSEQSPAIALRRHARESLSSTLGCSMKSVMEQRRSLPIFKFRRELMHAISVHQVLVVIGETGSGKTTQMTQYLSELGLTAAGIVGCTQPRRVAAMSIAKRVAEEVGCEVGMEVGYTIRFEDCSGPRTIIKYMTDGMLLREYLADGDLRRYSVVILDEAHERTVHTDILFTLSKSLARRRSNLKLIITSATLDAEKFSSYFFNCPIFTIPGRLFPVEVLYAKSPEPDYLDASLVAVLQIHLSEPAGDILVFLTGQEEIDAFCNWLVSRMASLGDSVPELVTLPVYAALPAELQARIFEPSPAGSRKCIVATNIAEASLTIDGIFYVVDPGFCKMKAYNSKLSMDALVVTPISQASARQRSGRAGRTGPGKCYRLYTESAFQREMLPVSIPEIQRTNLGNVVLQLKAMGIHDIISFDFMDLPPLATLVHALHSLYTLDALDNEGFLTLLGRRMAEFPLDPQLSKALMAASLDFCCGAEMVSIAAMLTIDHPFFRPKDKQPQADARRAKFFQTDGDHLTLLAVFDSWRLAHFSTPWCYENFIQARSMRRALDVRKQIVGIMDRFTLNLKSSGRNSHRVCKAFVAGFFKNAAKQDPREPSLYTTLIESMPVQIHPSSSLIHNKPEWLVYHELIMTTREYMHHVISVKPSWLLQLAPRFYKLTKAAYNPQSKHRERIEPLYDRFNPNGAWRLSKRRG